MFTLSEASPGVVVQEPVSYENALSGYRLIVATNFRLLFDPKNMLVREAWFRPRMHAILQSISTATSTAIPFGVP